MFHTMVVEIPDTHLSRRQKSADEIESGLTSHIERWGGWPGVKVVEYHREKMTEDPDPEEIS
jgi:hypothetical protein